MDALRNNGCSVFFGINMPENLYPISEKCAAVILQGFVWSYSEGDFDTLRGQELDDLLIWIKKTYPQLAENFRFLPFPDHE